VQGVRLGNYFWILFGFNGHDGVWIPQEKTSIWTIEKEKWIQGPKVPILLLHKTFCATAINSTFVIFIGMLDSVVTYDFTTEIWSSIPIPWNISSSACNSVQDKQAKT
jgi:hypothetical protein